MDLFLAYLVFIAIILGAPLNSETESIYSRLKKYFSRPAQYRIKEVRAEPCRSVKIWYHAQVKTAMMPFWRDLDFESSIEDADNHILNDKQRRKEKLEPLKIHPR